MCEWNRCVPECKTCSAEIFFAWDMRFDKWVPVDMNCLRGDEEEYRVGSLLGVVRLPFHMRHRCGFTPHVELDGLPPHRVLYVAPDAPEIVIRAAFQALAREAHPDRGGSEEVMRELNSAYEAMLSALPKEGR